MCLRRQHKVFPRQGVAVNHRFSINARSFGECEGYIGEKSPACVFECAFEKFSLRLLLFSAAKLLLTVCVRRWLSQLMMPFSVRP